MIRLGLLIVLLCSTLPAQDTLTVVFEPPQWFTAGIGGSTKGLSVGFVYSVENNGNLLSVRYTHSSEFNVLGASPSETVWDAGLLYGPFLQSSEWFISISGGISLVGGVSRGALITRGSGWSGPLHQENSFSLVGIPLETQMMWRPFERVGFGLYSMANINRVQSVYGLLLTVQIGRFVNGKTN